jgi:hypothetical protein
MLNVSENWESLQSHFKLKAKSKKEKLGNCNYMYNSDYPFTSIADVSNPLKVNYIFNYEFPRNIFSKDNN